MKPKYIDPIMRWVREAAFDAPAIPQFLHDLPTPIVEAYRQRRQQAIREWNYRR